MVDYIKMKLSDRKPKMIGNIKKSAVMIFLTDEDKPQILFEVRALTLRQQPGDVCLPGGKMEENESPKQAAIRESIEELNLHREDFKVLGQMDYVVTPYNYIIYPFVALLKNRDIRENKGEVDHTFKVPLSFFENTIPQAHYIDVIQKPRENFPFHLIANGENYKFREGSIPEYFYIYENHVIWGYTALIIKSFIEIILRKEG